MIILDRRVGSAELLTHVRSIGVSCELGDLEFGDACFEGKGPDNGTLLIGIERKTLHDMLSCIEDSRYSAHQLVGMKQMYAVSVLMIEGHWKPHDPKGFLMEGFHGGTSWGWLRHRTQRTMYAKLYRYLISVQMAGVMVSYSRDPWHTAYNICEWYHWSQKSWGSHTALTETQKIAIPTFERKPSLLRRWAADLDGIGAKLSGVAEKHFKTPLKMANADEGEWLRVPGVGVKTAQSIVKEIWGHK